MILETDDQAEGPDFDIQRVLRRMLAVAREQGWRLAVIAVLLFGVPGFFYRDWLEREDAAAWTREAASVAVMLLMVLGHSAISLISLNRSQAMPVTLRAVLGEAVAAFPGMLAIAVLQFLGVGLGLILLVVPGLYIAASWSVAGPVQLVHNEGIIPSLRISLKMTDGAKKSILLVMLTVLLPPFVVFYLVGKLVDFLPAGELIWRFGLAPLDSMILPVLSALTSASIFHELKWGGGEVRPAETAEHFA